MNSESHIQTNRILWLLNGGILLLASAYLYRGFSFLLSESRLPVDLALRWWEIQRLFSGENIYALSEHLPYPPGALLSLYPLIGWVPREEAAYVWAFWNLLALVSIVWVTWLFVRTHLSGGKLTAVLLAVLAFQSIGQTLGVGQITVVYMGAFAWFLWLVTQDYFHKAWLKWLAAPLLLIFFAGKFTIFLPVCAFLLLKREHYPVILIAGAAHFFAFIWAGAITGEGLLTILREWLDVKEEFEALGSLDLSALLGALGVASPWSIIIALAGMCVLVFWLHKRDYPILLAIAILMIYARFWMYHNHYDNLMLWPVYLVLILVVSQAECTISYKDWGLLILFIITLMLPARVLYWDAPFYGIFLMFQVVVWCCMVYYLVTKKKDLEELNT